ncbi:hypothetical protein J8A97_24345 [Vibrio parahaemolyticus]|nr:hypothetical protein [Vibrio parahaemolyticus]
MNSKEVVLAFWDAMKTNDFAKASEWLSPDFEGFWPQSGELIVGRDNFTAINTYYPANGIWEFVVHSIFNGSAGVAFQVGEGGARAGTHITKRSRGTVNAWRVWLKSWHLCLRW